MVSLGCRTLNHRLLHGSLAAVAAAALAVGTATVPASAEDGGDPLPVETTPTGVDTRAPVAGAVVGSGPATKPGRVSCTTPTQSAANVNTSCEGSNPHNETSIAVNPTDPDNIIGGANDYQLGVNPGGHVSERLLSRAHVSFDGGRTWSSQMNQPTS